MDDLPGMTIGLYATKRVYAMKSSQVNKASAKREYWDISSHGIGEDGHSP